MCPTRATARPRRPRTALTASARNEDLLGAAGHFERGAAGKRQQQQTARVGASEDQPRHPVRQRLGFAGASPRSDQQRRPGPLVRTDAIGSSAALRRVQPLQKRVDGGRSAGSVPFLFHRNRDNIAGSPAQSRQVSTGKSVRARYHRPWVADRRRESLDAPSEHTRQPHTGAEHLRLNASVSGALRGSEGSNLASSIGESANPRSHARLRWYRLRAPPIPRNTRNAAEIHGFVPRYQKFESISLHRGVRCEPTFGGAPHLCRFALLPV